MSENFQNNEQRDASEKITQTTDSTLERLVEALTKIDATINRLNDRLEALERRVNAGQAANKKQARWNLSELGEDDFDATFDDWTDYPDAYKKGFDNDWDDDCGNCDECEVREFCDSDDEWEDVYDCAADVDEFSNGSATVSKVRHFDDCGLKVGERDDEWITPNELKAAENAEKIALERGTYRVGVDLPSGRYWAKPLEKSAVVRVICSQWRGVYTLECEKETPERTKNSGAFNLAMKLIDGATMRTDDPIELTYLSPIETTPNKTLIDE